jgi:hypothetical protein
LNDVDRTLKHERIRITDRFYPKILVIIILPREPESIESIFSGRKRKRTQLTIN